MNAFRKDPFLLSSVNSEVIGVNARHACFRLLLCERAMELFGCWKRWEMRRDLNL
jgi:hypothetical protein